MKLPVKYHELLWDERIKVREEYIKLQGGLCMFCEQPLSGKPLTEVLEKKIDWRLFPPNFLKYPVHLQHCHNSGWTEGAVHAHCNAVLWQYHGR